MNDETCIKPLWLSDPLIRAYMQTSVGDEALLIIALERETNSPPKEAKPNT